MKKIAYIEIDTHAEIALCFYKLMRDSTQFDVDFFWSQKVKNTIGITDNKITLSEQSLLLDQLSAQHYDLVIIGTAHRYFGVFAEITKRFNTAVVLHNLNFVKVSKKQLFFSIFKNDLQYRIKLFLKEFLLQKDMVFKGAKKLLVLDPSFTKSNLAPVFLPVFYNEFQQEQTPSTEITIVVPGSVSQQRRDYLHIIKKVKELKNLGQNFKFVFLGKASHQELKWLQDAEKELPSFVKFKYFTEKVSQFVFDDWMIKASFIWCPIQEKTTFFSQTEWYGKTKMSGNIGDAIRYGKLAIFPVGYDAENSFIVAEEEDLQTQFIKLAKMSFDFEKVYRKDLIKIELEKTINNLL